MHGIVIEWSLTPEEKSIKTKLNNNRAKYSNKVLSMLKNIQMSNSHYITV